MRSSSTARRPASPHCASVAATQSLSLWRCSDGINIGHWTFDIEHSPRRRRGLGRTDCCRRGAGVRAASGDARADDAAADGRAARRRVARPAPRCPQHDSLSRDGRGGPPGVHADCAAGWVRAAVRTDRWLSARLSGRGMGCWRSCDRRIECVACGVRRIRRAGADPPGWSRPARDSHGQPLGGRAVRHVAVPARRPAEAGFTGAGPDAAHPNDSRAPLMARVSFEDMKRVGIALGWIVLYGVVGFAIKIGIGHLVIGWGGAPPAMLILALLFGIAHARNPSATVFSTVNVALAAVWLSFAFFSAGGMALAWGLHFGWNAGLAILFDAPVSGYAFQVPVVEYTPGGHAWVDGGPFGPEGGIVTTIVLIAGTLAVIGARVKQPRTWLAG